MCIISSSLANTGAGVLPKEPRLEHFSILCEMRNRIIGVSLQKACEELLSHSSLTDGGTKNMRQAYVKQSIEESSS